MQNGKDILDGQYFLITSFNEAPDNEIESTSVDIYHATSEGVIRDEIVYSNCVFMAHRN